MIQPESQFFLFGMGDREKYIYKNKSLIRYKDNLCIYSWDGYDEEFEQYFGRTYADSPEIDGRVWIATQDDLSEGEFVAVCIDGLIDGDLSGYIVEE